MDWSYKRSEINLWLISENIICPFSSCNSYEATIMAWICVKRLEWYQNRLVLKFPIFIIAKEKIYCQWGTFDQGKI